MDIVHFYRPRRNKLHTYFRRAADKVECAVIYSKINDAFFLCSTSCISLYVPSEDSHGLCFLITHGKTASECADYLMGDDLTKIVRHTRKLVDDIKDAMGLEYSYLCRDSLKDDRKYSLEFSDPCVKRADVISTYSAQYVSYPVERLTVVDQYIATSAGVSMYRIAATLDKGLEGFVVKVLDRKRPSMTGSIVHRIDDPGNGREGGCSGYMRCGYTDVV